MTHNLDDQTKELTGTVEKTLWTLSILDYRANELRLACEAGMTEDQPASDLPATESPDPNRRH